MLRRISVSGSRCCLRWQRRMSLKKRRLFVLAMWMKEIPPCDEQERYEETACQVPTGETNCTTVDDGYSVQTNCKQIMKTEYYKNTCRVRAVDRNASRRDAQIAACTQQRCNQKYGDAQCNHKRITSSNETL